MPELPEITDRESLNAWLQTRPRENSVIIAHRASMRVAPAWCAEMSQEWARERDFTSLLILRSCLTSGVAAKYPTPEVRASAFASASAASDAIRPAAIRPASASASAVSTAIHAASDAIQAVSAANHAAFAVHSASASGIAFDIHLMWRIIEADVHQLLAGSDPLADPLWHGNNNPLADLWDASLPILRDTPGGEFWIDWYQRALDGRPQNWPMLRDIALIDDEIWKQGGEALDQRISDIQMEHAADTATDDERIKPNPPDEVLPPTPDPALPLHINDENRISFAPHSMTREEIEDDIIRPQLRGILKDQVTELVRISGNRDDSVYRAAMKLSALLEPQFAEMDPLAVHLQIEVLRRRSKAATADDDRDVLLAIDAVIQTGPGLTLDTRPVNLFLDRARRNQLLQKEAAEQEAEIRLAESIAASEFSAPDTQEIARLAADPSEINQHTAIRPTLDRNYVILAACAGSVLSSIAGNLITADLVVPAQAWLVANYDTILILAKYWGEPFVAWITPILAHIREIDEGLPAPFRRP